YSGDQIGELRERFRIWVDDITRRRGRRAGCDSCRFSRQWSDVRHFAAEQILLAERRADRYRRRDSPRAALACGSSLGPNDLGQLAERQVMKAVDLWLAREWLVSFTHPHPATPHTHIKAVTETQRNSDGRGVKVLGC